ncbi:MAG TPA: ribosome silencing factor [Steroidobacteraceae bacterium]|nr:ribosome silencing factor [Steroidobacteraceae bacterium]
MTARKTPRSPTRTATPAAADHRPRRPARAGTRQARSRDPAQALAELVTAALGDLKAQNVAVLDVRELTDVTDTIVIASGTSDRHVKSLAGRVVERAKEAGFRSLGIEGEREGEWVLVDLRDVIVHVMLPRVREFYALEKLWGVRSAEFAAPA